MKIKILFVLLVFSLFSNRAFAQTNSASITYSREDLQKLVGPIALYPDPLLAQVLPASTYPLEIVEAARIIHSKKDFSKIEAQNWDPSVKAVAHYPDVLKTMSERLDWTQQLGQAVLSQQQDVMQSIQVMREKAQTAGNLQNTPQQTVRQVSNTIEIVPADPEIIYVPTYDTELVYVTPVVPFYHPLISFSVGFPLGDWLFAGFYWPTNSIFCAGYPYWRGWWRNPWYGHGYYPNSVTNFNNVNTTNITNTTVNNTNINNTNIHNVNVTQNNFKPWAHDNDHGTPFHGGMSHPSEVGFHNDHPIEGGKGMDPRPNPGMGHDGKWNPGNSDHAHWGTAGNSPKEMPGGKNFSHMPNLPDKESGNNMKPVGSFTPTFSKDHPSNVEEAQKANLEKFQHGMNTAQKDHPSFGHVANKIDGTNSTNTSHFSPSFQRPNTNGTASNFNGHAKNFHQDPNPGKNSSQSFSPQKFSGSVYRPQNQPSPHFQQAPHVVPVSATTNHPSSPPSYVNSHGGNPTVASGHRGGGSHIVARNWGKH